MRYYAAMTTKAMLAVALLLAIGACKDPTKRRGGATIKEARAYFAETVAPLAAEWQAAESRVESLRRVAEAKRLEVAIRQANEAALRWAELLAAAPSPLPLKAPFKTLASALVGLKDAAGPARDKSIETLDKALGDLQRRRVSAVPNAKVPLTEGPWLVRFWRDLHTFATLTPYDPDAKDEGAEDGKDEEAMDEGDKAEGDKAEEEDEPKRNVDWLLELRKAIAAEPPAATEGERAARALADKVLDTVGHYRDNPPQVDARTALLFRMGRVGREAMDAAFCEAAVPLEQRLIRLGVLEDALLSTCSSEDCEPAAADLIFHPQLRELRAMAARIKTCAQLAPPGDPEAPVDPAPADPASAPVDGSGSPR
jgi:hypothetical protein